MPQNKQAFVNAIVQSLGAGQPNRRPLIAMRGIRKSYYIGQPNELEILHGIDLTVWPGEFVAIVGESGSGKSTLMNIIGVLDKPTSGEYTLDGVDIHKADDDELAGIRNNKIGFVFQTYNLIGRQSALKNVELPMLYAGIPGGERTRRAKEWLDRVGMGERARHQPNELSGGQKQRVAIARAMVNDPALILADEPTGALDSETSRVVMDLFHEMHEKYHKTIVLITHNPALAEECQRVLTLHDGRIIAERKGSGVRGALGIPFHGVCQHQKQQNAQPAHHAGHYYRHCGGYRHRNRWQQPIQFGQRQHVRHRCQLHHGIADPEKQQQQRLFQRRCAAAALQKFQPG